jgi:hypothetical protein
MRVSATTAVLRRRWSAPRAGVRTAVVLEWLAPAAAFLAIAVRRWQQTGHYVTGLDAGNWMAFGRLLVGDAGKSTGGAYPPLVPLLMHAGRVMIDPMPAAKLVGLGSLLALMTATYLVARQAMAWWFALLAAVTAGLAGVNVETVAYGGYPQNFALALGLLAACCFAHYLATGRQRTLVAMTALLALAALTHHMYFAITQAVLALIWLIWITTRPRTAVWLDRTLGLAVAEAIAILCFLPVYIALERAGFRPPFNPSQLGLQGALRYTIVEAPILWIGLFATALVFCALTVQHRAAPMWQLQAALMLGSAGGFVITREPRLVPMLTLGAVLAAGQVWQVLWERARSTPVAVLVPACALIVPVVLWPRADRRASDFYYYYRVAGPSMLDAATWVDAHHGDDRVVVRQDRNGWPIGWWFEGLTGAKVVVGSSLKWLAFPRERDNARLAGLFFDQKLTSAQAAELAARNHVDLLVFRKWDWIGWQAWLAEPAPAVEAVFDDGQFMILRVRRP